jgi:hypothetical protein
MPYHGLTITQITPVISNEGLSLVAGSGWPNDEYWIVIGAVYGDETRLETIGIVRPTVPSITTTTGQNRIKATWTAPSVLPDYYVMFWSAGPSPDIELSSFIRQGVLEIDRNLLEYTFDAYDVGTSYILGSGEVILNPITFAPGETRKLLVKSANGITRRKSWVNPTLFTRIKLEITQLSCSADDYHQLQRWCRWGTLLQFTEPTGSMTNKMPLFSSFTGTIEDIPQIYSWGKVNADSCEMTILVESETYV